MLHLYARRLAVGVSFLLVMIIASLAAWRTFG